MSTKRQPTCGPVNADYVASLNVPSSPPLTAAIEKLKAEESEKRRQRLALENTPEAVAARALQIKLESQRQIQDKEQRQKLKAARKLSHIKNTMKAAEKKLKNHPEGVFCYYCLTRLTPANYTIDHVIPKSRGGTNEGANKVPACRDCNTEKGDSLDPFWKKGCKIRAEHSGGFDLEAIKKNIAAGSFACAGNGTPIVEGTALKSILDNMRKGDCLIIPTGVVPNPPGMPENWYVFQFGRKGIEAVHLIQEPSKK